MANYPTNVSISEARELIEEHADLIATECVDLADGYGRVLAASVRADRNLPPFDRVTMDGIAVKASAGANKWSCAGTQYAGDPALSLEVGDQCIEIMTGAALPNGADTVIPVEWIKRSGNDFFLNQGEKIVAGQFVHPKGSDAAESQVILTEGTCLSGIHLSIAATVGAAQLQVQVIPKVCFVSTGNELRSQKEQPGAVEIRRSNDLTVLAECSKVGAKLSSNLHIQDCPDEIRRQIVSLQKENDVIVFSGGVSKGKKDFVLACAQACGFEVIFHRIRQKPGGPLLFAKHSDGTYLMGLPGNPMSTLVCSRLYLRSLLSALCGYPLWSENKLFQGVLPGEGVKTMLQFVFITKDENAGQVARALQTNTSGDIVRVADASGMLVIPPANERDTMGDFSGVFEYFDWDS